MSVATRLDRITPSLSGRQRAILAMRSIAAGQEPDRDLWRIDDEHERRGEHGARTPAGQLDEPARELGEAPAR